MKKLLLASAICFAYLIQAQEILPTQPDQSVSNASPITLNLNDVANSSAFSAGTYETLRLVTDWNPNTGSPNSDEASLEVITTAGSAILTPARIGANSNSNATELVFNVPLAGFYQPQFDGFLDITLRQSGVGTTGNWTNLYMELLECVQPIVTVTTNEDCMNDQFYINVNLSDVGSSTPVQIYDSDFTSYHSVSVPGNYQLGPFYSQQFVGVEIIGDVSGCYQFYYDISFDCQSLSLDEENKIDMVYFPNPVKETLNISSKSQINEIEVFNINGQLVSNSHYKNNAVILNMTALNNGLYFLKIRSEMGIQTIKILKE